MTLQTGLSNVQLELLKTFSHNLNEEDLKELKQLLVHFFAKKAMDEADKIWDEENWNEDKVEDLLNTKLRKRD